MRPSGTHLDKRVCPSVHRSVGPLVRRSVGPSVRQSVGWSVMIELKSVNTRIYDATVMIFCVCVSKHGVEEGMDGASMPLPTRAQQYCDF